jgi:aspartyl-tRNA(Asn)/glutamyl-tRNA(Gln) amidotransferase subunit A
MSRFPTRFLTHLSKKIMSVTNKAEDNIAVLPAHRLAALIAEGKLSSTRLTAECLARIRATDDKLHAFVAVYEDEAMAIAAMRDQKTYRGGTLGPLHGVPVALKDLCELEGRITTCGSMMWRDRISPTTATIARRLEAAGTILLGKTHMVEFAYGGWGTNATMGTAWNPWDLNVPRVPGGSSSGSAVAVAAGLVPFAIGSDTGGSVRIPASMCGIVGLKTTVGRISNHGILPLSETLDTIGPLTRSVQDAALIFAVLQGPDPADSATLNHPPTDPVAALKVGVEGLRLGVLSEKDRDGVDAQVLGAYDDACRTLELLGARLAEVHLPDSFPAYLDQTGQIIAAEGYTVHRNWIESPAILFDEHVRARVCAGKSISAAAYIDALRRRRQVQHEIGEIMRNFAAFLTPTTPIPAIPLAEVDENALPLSRFTRAVNYLDMCALALPCGLSASGLPLSLQIIGHGYDEAGILRIGWAFENATDWCDRQPDLSSLLNN